jgi:hypothetical protein
MTITHYEPRLVFTAICPNHLSAAVQWPSRDCHAPQIPPSADVDAPCAHQPVKCMRAQAQTGMRCFEIYASLGEALSGFGRQTF